MLRLNLFAIIVFCAINLQGQSANDLFGSAEKAYERGDYARACELCAKALRVKDTHKRAQELTQTSFDALRLETISTNRRLASQLESRDGLDLIRTYEEIIEGFEILSTTRDQLMLLPKFKLKSTGQLLNLGDSDFYSEIQEYKTLLSETREEAAAYHYDRGVDYSKRSDKSSQRLAAREFQKANQSSKGFKDAVQRYNECRDKGLIRVAILPFVNKSGRNDFGAVEDILMEDIIGSLTQDEGFKEFTAIVTRSELQTILSEQKLSLTSIIDESTVVTPGLIQGVDYLVTGKINQLSYVTFSANPTNFTDKGEVVVGQKNEVRNGKTVQVPVWGPASVTYTKYERKATAGLNGTFQILDVQTGQILQSGNFDKARAWEASWGRIVSGDQRVLSRDAKSLCSMQEQSFPVGVGMVNSACKLLSTEISSEIRAFFTGL